MERLAVICFLFAMCAFQVSAFNPYNHIKARLDHSTVDLKGPNDFTTVQVQGETRKVNDFIKAVEEGRASLDGPYLDLKIYTLTGPKPWCGAVDWRHSEETTTEAVSNPDNRINARLDKSTVDISWPNDFTMVHVQGETKIVDDFLKAVEEGRASMEGPYLNLEIITFNRPKPWCRPVPWTDSEATTEPTKIEDPIQYVEVQTRPSRLFDVLQPNGRIMETSWMEDANRLFWGANSI